MLKIILCFKTIYIPPSNFKIVQVYMFYYSVAFHVAVISFLM